MKKRIGGALLFLVACGSSTAGQDGGPAGTVAEDGGVSDAGIVDAGRAQDAGVVDAGPMADGGVVDAGEVCASDGETYCGGHGNTYDPNILYSCSGGAPGFDVLCTSGCVVTSTEHDYCEPTDAGIASCLHYDGADDMSYCGSTPVSEGTGANGFPCSGAYTGGCVGIDDYDCECVGNPDGGFCEWEWPSNAPACPADGGVARDAGGSPDASCSTGADCAADQVCVSFFCGPPTSGCPQAHCVANPCSGQPLACAFDVTAADAGCAATVCAASAFCDTDADAGTILCSVGG